MTTASSISDVDVGSARRPRVLVADDHPAMLALTAAALAAECLVVGSVDNGRELLTEAERLHPDVIVLDITMPRLDGIEAARQLLRRDHHARVVFLTVHEDADFARAALDAGGLGYVVKARLASDLLPAIRAALADRRFISPTISLEETHETKMGSLSTTFRNQKKNAGMKTKIPILKLFVPALGLAFCGVLASAQAADKKPRWSLRPPLPS